MLFFPVLNNILYLVVQYHHVARVSIEPGVDGLAHAADLVQRRCMVVWPAKLQNLKGIMRATEQGFFLVKILSNMR